MWGDMSLWNVQGPLLHSGDHIVPRILIVDYTFKTRNQIPPHHKKYVLVRKYFSGVRMPYCETVEEFAKVLEHEVETITSIPPDR